MAALECPNCGTSMQRDAKRDLAVDVCPSCGGVWLDSGELNALATGMHGDIEYCSVDEEVHRDRFPERPCSRCPDTTMRKINLLRLSDIIFDWCPSCGGFFLDKGEVDRMNAELKNLTPNHEAEEYRAMHGRHLVRIDQANDVMAAQPVPGLTRVVEAGYLRLAVFFADDIPTRMHVSQEGWPIRLAKALGLFWGQDYKTGDEDFDARFRVQGEDEDRIVPHLDAAARRALLAFADEKPHILQQPGSLEVSSAGVVYVEGPYEPKSLGEIDVVQRAKPLIDRLVDLAEKIETVPEET
ncbi:MAG: zf-TFIIB domain-containing protein [Phycisphaerae bacterium]